MQYHTFDFHCTGGYINRGESIDEKKVRFLPQYPNIFSPLVFSKPGLIQRCKAVL